MTIKMPNGRHRESRLRAIGVAVLVMILVCSGPRPARAADGDLDQSFGKGGIVTTDLEPMVGPDDKFNEGRAIAVQADGKIVVGAQISLHVNGTGMNTAVIRYNSDGSLDTTFGSGGKVTTGYPVPGIPNVIAVQPDGKIVTGSLEGLTRFTADGSLDIGFGSGGALSTGKTVVDKLAFLPDGKIIAAGVGRPDSGPNFAVLRFNSDGSPDAGFGVGGQATAYSGRFAGISALVIQPDGKIIAGGASSSGGPYGPYSSSLARFNTDGTLDPAFGSSGLVITQSRIGFSAMTVSEGGKIVVFGAGPTMSGQTGGAFFGADRYNPDGSLDTTFGSGGFVTSPFFPGDNGALLLATGIDPDGKCVAAGQSQHGFALARYNSDGTPDTTFGSGGTVITHVTDPKDHGYPDTIRAIAFQPDGQIVVTGDLNDDTDIVVARYNAEPDFALSFSQPTDTMAAGTKARVTLNIARRGGYTGSVTVAPPDTSALDIRISPNPATTTDGSVTFKIKARGSAPLGSHDLVFAGQSDTGQAHSITLTLVVQ